MRHHACMEYALAASLIADIVLEDQVNTGLSNLAAHSAIIHGETLQALGIQDCAALERLDLSRCFSLSWLGVSGCPRLRLLILPDNGCGAELHIDFGAAPPNLRIAGAIADLDCCWTGGTAVAPGRRRPPLRSAYLGPLGDELPQQAELLMLTGGDAVGPLLDLSSQRTLLEAVLSGLPAIEGLRLPAWTRAAMIQDMHDLSTVTLTAAESLRIERAPRLAEVRGNGERLAILHSALTAPLHVNGAWQAVTVHDGGRYGVLAPMADDLVAPRVINGPGAEGAVRTLLADAVNGSSDASAAIFVWCRQARTPRGTLAALQALQYLAEAGLDPRACWRIRCELKLRQGLSRGWRWQLPTDQHLRGWVADLHLWLACQPKPAEALGEENPVWLPDHFAAVVEALAGCAGTPRSTLLLDLLNDGFRSAAYGLFPKPEPNVSLMAVETDLLRRVVQGLAALRRDPCCPGLVQAFCDWLRCNLRGEARADLLGALHLLGARAATEALLSEAADPQSESDLRRRAAALALAPYRAALFAFEVAHA
jgi:hypothetical protein